jgi:hypothetical protein
MNRTVWSSCVIKCVGRLNYYWPSPAVILRFESRRDPWPTLLFSPRHVRVLEVGSFLWQGEESVFLYSVCCTIGSSVPDWLLNGWPLPSQWFLVQSPMGLMIIFCLAVGAFRLCLQPGGPGPCIYVLQWRWPSYTPRHQIPFLLPSMTCRATVEVFQPTSTQGWLSVLHHRNSYIPKISSLPHDNRKVPLKHIIVILMLTAAKCSHLVLWRLMSYVTSGITNKRKLSLYLFMCILV